MNNDSIASAVMDGAVGQKVQAAIASGTMGVGFAGMMGLIQPYISFMAALVGGLLTFVLLIINLIKLSRMLKQKEVN